MSELGHIRVVLEKANCKAEEEYSAKDEQERSEENMRNYEEAIWKAKDLRRVIEEGKAEKEKARKEMDEIEAWRETVEVEETRQEAIEEEDCETNRDACEGGGEKFQDTIIDAVRGISSHNHAEHLNNPFECRGIEITLSAFIDFEEKAEFEAEGINALDNAAHDGSEGRCEGDSMEAEELDQTKGGAWADVIPKVQTSAAAETVESDNTHLDNFVERDDEGEYTETAMEEIMAEPRAKAPASLLPEEDILIGERVGTNDTRGAPTSAIELQKMSRKDDVDDLGNNEVLSMIEEASESGLRDNIFKLFSISTNSDATESFEEESILHGDDDKAVDCIDDIPTKIRYDLHSCNDDYDIDVALSLTITRSSEGSSYDLKEARGKLSDFNDELVEARGTFSFGNGDRVDGEDSAFGKVEREIATAADLSNRDGAWTSTEEGMVTMVDYSLSANGDDEIAAPPSDEVGVERDPISREYSESQYIINIDTNKPFQEGQMAWKEAERNIMEGDNTYYDLEDIIAQNQCVSQEGTGTTLLGLSPSDCTIASDWGKGLRLGAKTALKSTWEEKEDNVDGDSDCPTEQVGVRNRLGYGSGLVVERPSADKLNTNNDSAPSKKMLALISTLGFDTRPLTDTQVTILGLRLAQDLIRSENVRARDIGVWLAENLTGIDLQSNEDARSKKKRMQYDSEGSVIGRESHCEGGPKDFDTDQNTINDCCGSPEVSSTKNGKHGQLSLSLTMSSSYSTTGTADSLLSIEDWGVVQGNKGRCLCGLAMF